MFLIYFVDICCPFISQLETLYIFKNGCGGLLGSAHITRGTMTDRPTVIEKDSQFYISQFGILNVFVNSVERKAMFTQMVLIASFFMCCVVGYFLFSFVLFFLFVFSFFFNWHLVNVYSILVHPVSKSCNMVTTLLKAS